MKTHQLPAVRVTQELRDAAEAVLAEGETLSGLIEHALRSTVEYRQVRAAFLLEGDAAWRETLAGEPTRAAADVIAEMREMNAHRRRQVQGRGGRGV